MALDYYKSEELKDLGDCFLQNSVFELIVFNTLKDLENIKLSKGDYNNLFGLSSPIKVTVSDVNQIIIDIDVELPYGINVNKTIANAQKKILEAIIQMTGVINPRINMNLVKIDF